MPPQSRSLSASRFCSPPTVTELNWARYTCAGIIGVVGYLVARGASRGRMRAVLFGLGVLVVAFAVAALKHALAGH